VVSSRLVNQGRPQPSPGNGMLAIVADDEDPLKDFGDDMLAEGE
jgi:hypothetical protein